MAINEQETRILKIEINVSVSTVLGGISTFLLVIAETFWRR